MSTSARYTLSSMIMQSRRIKRRIHGTNISSIPFFYNVRSIYVRCFYNRLFSSATNRTSTFFFKSLLRTFFGLNARVLREISDGSLKGKGSFRPRLFANSGGRFGRIVKRGLRKLSAVIANVYSCSIRLERVVTSRNGLKTFTTGLWKHVSLLFCFVSCKKGLGSLQTSRETAS